MILRTTNPYPAILRRGQQNIFLTFPSQSYIQDWKRV